MKRLWIVFALVVAVGVAVWLWAPDDVVPGDTAPAPTTVAAVQAASDPARSAAEADIARVTTKRTVDAKQREAYLRRIADGVARRRGRGSADKPGKPDERESPAPRGENSQDDAERQEHAIQDKSDGELSDLMEAVTNDLMPLVDECYQAAIERDPTIAGLIDINLEMVGDEDVGGIVESFELGDENEIEDEPMIECIRETTLSTLFPAPQDSGRRGARLTLEFAPDPPE